METARCPVEGCHQLIGGERHVAVAGVKRLGAASEVATGMTSRGYLLTTTKNTKGYEIPGGCGVLTVQVLRLIMHLLLRHSIRTSPVNYSSASSTVATLFYPTAKNPSLRRAREELKFRLSFDWKSLLQSTSLSPEELAMALHLVLQKMRQLPAPPMDMTVSARYVDVAYNFIQFMVLDIRGTNKFTA
jgi:hypothetical protein